MALTTSRSEKGAKPGDKSPQPLGVMYAQFSMVRSRLVSMAGCPKQQRPRHSIDPPNPLAKISFVTLAQSPPLTGLRIGTWKAIVVYSKAALGRGSKETVPLEMLHSTGDQRHDITGLHKVLNPKERICHRNKHHDDSKISARRGWLFGTQR